MGVGSKSIECCVTNLWMHLHTKFHAAKMHYMGDKANLCDGVRDHRSPIIYHHIDYAHAYCCPSSYVIHFLYLG